MLDSVATSASPKTKLAKNIKPPNVAIVMPPISIIAYMAGALKLREEQVYVF